MTASRPSIVRHLGCCDVTLRVEYPARHGMKQERMQEIYRLMDSAVAGHRCEASDPQDWAASNILGLAATAVIVDDPLREMSVAEAHNIGDTAARAEAEDSFGL